MTTAELLSTLADQGITLSAEGNGIRVQPASQLTAVLRQAIRDHKGELLALLPAAEPVITFPLTWRTEWHLERNLLRRRMSSCTDPDVRQQLAELLAVTPASLAEWMLLGGRIRDMEHALRQQGRLPAV